MRKRLTLIIGVLLALLLTLHQESRAQQEAQYVCTPCGCVGDTKIVSKGESCSICGMSVVNLANPSAGLKYTNIWATQLCEMLSINKDIILLDVRSKEEYVAKDSPLKAFKNAINIPIGQITDRIKELAAYKDKEIIVYCSISARSTRVSQTLSSNGFKHIHNLMGGMNYWVNQPLDSLPCRDTYLNR